MNEWEQGAQPPTHPEEILFQRMGTHPMETTGVRLTMDHEGANLGEFDGCVPTLSYT